ncbi:hypothetical protein KKG83_05860 [Candidatus Micrarchaeota archaeon]|nr:hypothetical protein [Candidatus Micrarchaeota archaeon]
MVLPVKKFNVGAIQLALWENKGKEKKYFSVSLERRYTDSEGKWHGTNSFKVHDLPKAVLAMQKAYEYALLKEPEITKKEEQN